MIIRLFRAPGLLALIWLATMAPSASAQEANPLRRR
jgi:hypothetical protein